jgi:hypothetical protein
MKIETGEVHAKDILTWTALIIVAGLLGFAIHTNSKAISQAHRALCNQKQTLQVNISATKQFLIQHPQGIPGLSRAIFLRSIAVNTNSLAAFKDVECSQ